jgi:hypothetical protein
MCFSFPAFAAEEIPGDSCADSPTNAFRWAGAPENGGVVNGMFRNTNWLGVINFQSSGRVGIGTATPISPLHIDSSSSNIANGDASVRIVNESLPAGMELVSATNVTPFIRGRVSGGTIAAPTPANSGKSILLLDGQGYDGSAWSTGARMRFTTSTGWSGASHGMNILFSNTDNGSTTMTDVVSIYQGGRLGIRTTNPTSQLNVGGNLTSPGLIGGKDFAGSGFTKLLSIEDSAGTNRLTLTTGGNVGIGTTAPGSLLDVGKAGTTLGTLRLEGSTSGYVQLQTNVAAGSWNMTLPPDAGTSGYVLRTDGAGVTTWVAQGGATTLDGITAATGNQAGIANGAYTIQWNWNTLAGGSALKLASTSTAAAGNAQKMLEIALSGTNGTSAQTTYGEYISNTHAGTTSTNVGLYATASGGTTANYAAIFAAGNVGIGTATPAAALHVVGDIKYTGIIVDISDRRAKKDIRPLPTGQLAKMMQLQPVSFVMKDDPKGRTELGLIAQDTEPLFPDLVQTDPDGTKAMGYVGLVAPLIKAMQEQQAQIQEQRAEMRAGLAIVFCIALVPGFLLWRNRTK